MGEKVNETYNIKAEVIPDKSGLGKDRDIEQGVSMFKE